MTTERIIYHADALEWLTENSPLNSCSIITSLPDFTEFSALSLQEWKEWFIRAAMLCLQACPDDGVTIFYQRDAKHEGTWVNKAFLCQQAATIAGHNLLWHKIVCRAPPGSVTFGKPAYSHMLCFSREVRSDLAQSTVDVLPNAGKVTWTRGMGVRACEAACNFVLLQTRTRTIVDPFCGHGTVLAVANQMGMNAVGIEKGRKRAEIARVLQVPTKNGLPAEIRKGRIEEK